MGTGIRLGCRHRKSGESSRVGLRSSLPGLKRRRESPRHPAELRQTEEEPPSGGGAGTVPERHRFPPTRCKPTRAPFSWFKCLRLGGLAHCTGARSLTVLWFSGLRALQPSEPTAKRAISYPFPPACGAAGGVGGGPLGGLGLFGPLGGFGLLGPLGGFGLLGPLGGVGGAGLLGSAGGGVGAFGAFGFGFLGAGPFRSLGFLGRGVGFGPLGLFGGLFGLLGSFGVGLPGCWEPCAGCGVDATAEVHGTPAKAPIARNAAAHPRFLRFIVASPDSSLATPAGQANRELVVIPAAGILRVGSKVFHIQLNRSRLRTRNREGSTNLRMVAPISVPA